MSNAETEIKQMARDICHLPRRCEECEIPKINKGKCQARTYAERAYAKGWRKPTDERRRQ